AHDRRRAVVFAGPSDHHPLPPLRPALRRVLLSPHHDSTGRAACFPIPDSRRLHRGGERTMRSLLFCLALAAAASAHQPSLSGRVHDPSGAIVPEAKVTIVKTDTGARLETSSSEAGVYEFPSLQPGGYEIRVEKAGFQPLLREKLTLHVGDRLQLDLTL